MSKLPSKPQALVCDFDGVFTDNRVILSEDGKESVICHRGDGLGIENLRKKAFPIIVISKEKNKVVQKRCAKLKIQCFHGKDDKKTILEKWIQENSLNSEQVIYIGNDINDLECMAFVGCGVAVNDAEKIVLEKADLILERKGGFGAVRELCDLILEQLD
jgi:YrbI family 3-deoxy-D-manno-octulosonate 8-phosphate phosphatase